MEAGDICKIFEQVGVLFDDGHIRSVDAGDFDGTETLLLFTKKDPVVNREGLPVLPTRFRQSQRDLSLSMYRMTEKCLLTKI